MLAQVALVPLLRWGCSKLRMSECSAHIAAQNISIFMGKKMKGAGEALLWAEGADLRMRVPMT